MMKKLSVIIGRFQIDRLHAGHYWLLNQANNKGDKLVVILGNALVPLTNKNPLPYEMRKTMIKRKYPKADVYGLSDHVSDVIWSNNVDAILAAYEPNYTITLYGSRDSFINSYSGKHKCEVIDAVDAPSGTDIRKAIANTAEDDPAFGRGVIYAIENKYPVAYHTVDVAVVKTSDLSSREFEWTRYQLLLGRKKDSDLWRFIGGFVDPADYSAEDAAKRELYEEVEGISVEKMNYIGSCKVEDGRYRGTKDGVITSFFLTYMLAGNPTPTDDIEEVQFFDLKWALIAQIVPEHRPLFTMLYNHLKP